MKIIKMGNPKQVKRFACTECGCIFEAEEKEYDIIHGDCYSVRIECKCPCCGKAAPETKITETIAEDYH